MLSLEIITKLKNAKMLSISTTIDKQFATEKEGLTFEPQAQLAYQYLMFDPPYRC